jgi:hypothetical protein
MKIEFILYKSFYNLIIRKFGINNIITKKQIFCELGMHFIVPKHLRMEVIDELIALKLIRKESRNIYIILNNQDYLEKIKC